MPHPLAGKNEDETLNRLLERAKKVAVLLSDLEYVDQLTVINFTNGIVERNSMREDKDSDDDNQKLS